MRIDVHAHGFELRPQLRTFVESRLLAALGLLHARIQVAIVHLEARGGHQAQTTSCEVIVRLRPSGEVRVRAEDALLHVAIARASNGIAAAVERDAAQRQPTPAASASGETRRRNALGAVRDGRRIPRHPRERLGRPTQNRLRPARLPEQWRPPGVEDDELPDEKRSSSNEPFHG